MISVQLSLRVKGHRVLNLHLSIVGVDARKTCIYGLSAQGTANARRK